MKSNCLLRCLMAFFILCAFSNNALADTTYVNFGSTWKYLDIGSAAPIGAGAADWRNIAFADGAWNSGPAEFGYGDGKERTPVNYGGNPSAKYITTYFRKLLNIANIGDFGGIRLNGYIDDGAVIYVNGTEVARTNISGTPVYSTLASAAAAENGNGITSFDISTSAFVSGDNMVAVEVHQSAATSSDLSFDLELIAKPGGGTVFNFGATWKYLDNGSNQGTAWIPAAFNDASWKTGVGRFGFGDTYTTAVFSGCGTSNYPAAENGAPGSCGPKIITTYFRKTFNITGLSNYTSFTMNVYRDDGIAIYVNGTEVARDLLTAGATYTTTASNAADDGQAINTYAVPASYFQEGSNTVAVEMHQTNNTSSDLTFDMQLTGTAGSAEPDITRGPLLQMVSGNAVTIRWTTTSATSSRIKYGSDENSLTNVLQDNTAVTEHELRITSLNPDTKYFYGVGSAGSIVKGSYRNYFTTSPPANTTRKIRIGVFGDPGTGNSVQKSTRDSYIRLKSGYNNSELAIMLGDNAY
ncbi:MAG: fibronectin type III domain-containing protein, partial [Bacteroidota bacterium]